MPGPAPKSPDRRQNRIKRPELGIVQALPVTIPEPPTGLLKGTIDRWEAYWRSPVAQIARDSGGIDLPGLHRWILNVDEWTRAMRALRRKRIVLGSMGQPTLNPLAGYISARESAIAAAEVAYGMTPIARLRLGIAVGQAKLTAQQMNKDLDASDRAEPDEFASEWEQT